MPSWYVLRRLFRRGRWEQVFVERLSEPLHLNFLSLFVAIVGSYRLKVAFDLIVRQQYAFPVLYAADVARRFGYSRVTLVELGVASGAGMLNLCRIAERTTAATGIEFRIVGFDSGSGMPPAIDYRDLPEHFQQGDFPMLDFEGLRRALPPNAELVIGDVAETAPEFAESLSEGAPLGFVAVDVDYYSAARAGLSVVSRARPACCLPIVPVYLDDIGVEGSNPWNGELLAVSEFNAEQAMRKIAPFTLLRSRRIFKNPQWIDRMFAAHVHDHPLRAPGQLRAQRIVRNEYIS